MRCSGSRLAPHLSHDRNGDPPTICPAFHLPESFVPMSSAMSDSCSPPTVLNECSVPLQVGTCGWNLLRSNLWHDLGSKSGFGHNRWANFDRAHVTIDWTSRQTVGQPKSRLRIGAIAHDNVPALKVDKPTFTGATEFQRLTP